jgi:hypothetical protein
MILDTITEAVGLGTFDPAVQVLLLTVIGGVAVKAGALAFWRNTGKLVAPATYLRAGLLLTLAAVATIVAARRGVVEGGVTTLSVYALVLAKLVDQSYDLVTGA